MGGMVMGHKVITPCKLRKLDIALVYQKPFGIVYIFAIYVFLVIVTIETRKQ